MLKPVILSVLLVYSCGSLCIASEYPSGSLRCKLDFGEGWDCTNRMLTSIPSHILAKDTIFCATGLFLSDNKLKNITGSLFRNMTCLTWLHLSQNEIRTITPGAFSGLSMLKVLYLNKNRLTSLHANVFQDLAMLEYLNLNLNFFSTIPSHAFAPLKSLEHLELEGNDLMSYTIGEEFQHLSKLKSLEIQSTSLYNTGINHFTTTAYLTQDTFQYLNVPKENNLTLKIDVDNSITMNVTSFGTLGSVKHFHARGRPLDDFKSTKCNLESLFLYNFPLDDMDNPFYFTKRWNESLTSLSITYSRIVKIHGPVFHKTPLLRTLDLSYQDVLEHLSDDAFDGLSQLQELILSHNSFTDVPSNALKFFKKHKTLKKLDLSYNRIRGSIPIDAFAGVPSITHLNLAGNYKIDFKKDWTTTLINLTELNLKDTYVDMFLANKMPALKTLNLGVPSVSTDGLLIRDQLCFVAEKIEQAFIPNYSFTIPINEILGDRCPALIELDLSGCLTFSVNYDIEQRNFQLPVLEKLNMARNKLQSLQEILFIKAPQLLDLDVSSNEIQTIENSVLPMLQRVTHLQLSGNKLVSLSGLLHLKSLTNLYAAENAITSIERDLLYKDNRSSLMVLDVGNNPFDCSCKIVDFQHWIQTDTTTWLFSSGSYICATPEHVKGLSITEVKLDCKSKLPIYFGVGAACLVVIVICITSAVYYRWHIKYKLFLVFRRRYRRYISYIDNADLLDDEEIEAPRVNHDYDAYVAYDASSEKDELWVINKLRINLEEGPQPFRLCIQGRDFIPGAPIAETMMESIQKSRTTILILTTSFVESEWCHFEMEMARMRLFHENRDVLILLMLEEVPDDKLTLTLRQLLCKQECFKWPQDEAGQVLFWRRLREEIMKPVRVDRRHDP